MELDYLLLADRAEAVNGKLYMVGGGWDRLGLATIPGPADFDVAVGVLVGYNETNSPHRIELVLEDEDNKPVLGPIAAQFELGRPAGMKLGQTQRFQMVLRGPFPLPKAGSFHWVVALDGDRKTRTQFWVDQVVLPQIGPPPQPPSA
jgi:hypothetical protein